MDAVIAIRWSSAGYPRPDNGQPKEDEMDDDEKRQWELWLGDQDLESEMVDRLLDKMMPAILKRLTVIDIFVEGKGRVAVYAPAGQ